MSVSRLRYLLLFGVLLMMFAGGWAALQRAGFALPMVSPSLIGMHGPLMIGGVFGALIALERAVAIASVVRSPRHWSFTAPALAGMGGVLLILGGASFAARLCLLGGSALFLSAYLHTATKYRYWSLHTAIMGLGAILWLVGNVFWVVGHPISTTAHMWLGFIVLTIVGERLELSRVLRFTRRTTQLLIVAVAIYTTGILLMPAAMAAGIRVAGAGVTLIALWLLRFDLAGRRLRQPGITRYIALCLFTGYFWLGIAGLLLIGFGPVYAGFQYDAIIHAISVGFVFSMVFGHAPVILPALTGRQVTFTPMLYLPLIILHLSITVRVLSDLSLSFDGRLWASALNAVGVLLFLATLVLRVIRQPQ